MSNARHAHTPAPWTWHKNYGHMTGGDNSEVFSSEPYEGMWLSFSPNQEGNARLIAAAPELFEALEIIQSCGAPSPVSLYDEEGVEGLEWTHPDGRDWSEIGSWDQPPPLHPVAQAAISKAKGGPSLL